MTTEEILVIAGIVVAVLVVLGLVLWLAGSRRRKRRERLRERYGSEYEATVDAKGRRAGVADLDHREEERRSLRLRDPDESTRADLRGRMADLQFRFVEEPNEVMLETQRVVVDALHARGYPIAENREQALRLLSVDHPEQTPSLRALLEGNYGRDVARMRDLFLDSRRALLQVLDVSYTPRDLTHAPPRERPAPAGGPERREPVPADGPREVNLREGTDVPPPRREPPRDREPDGDRATGPEPGRAPRREAEPRR